MSKQLAKIFRLFNFVVFFLSIVFFNMSCMSNDIRPSIENKDSITKEISDTTLKKHIEFLEDRFALTPAELHRGQFVRFWGGSKPMDTCILINIEHQADKSIGQMYLFGYSLDLDSQTLSLSYNKKIGVDRTDWKTLFGELEKLKIMTLPDFQSIPNYHINNHDVGFSVEVFNGRNYRLYHYPDLWLNKEKKEVIQFQKILALLESRLGVKLD